MRTLVIVLLLLGSLLALMLGVLVVAVDGGTCSPHEGGSGCGFKFVMTIPWIIALGLAVTAIILIVQRRWLPVASQARAAELAVAMLLSRREAR